MRNAVLALAVAAIGGIGLLAAPAAEASPVSPGIAAAGVAAPAAAQNVAWVCDPWRCVWRPGARVVVPPYARGWGPPRGRNCYWSRVRAPRGGWHWVQVCPSPRRW